MKLKNQKGQALVEMALIMPLFLLVVFGITEFGRALYILNSLNNAAREGARRASVSATVPLDMTALQNYIKASIPFDQTGIVINIAPASPLAGTDTIKVSVNLPFKSSVPIIDQLKSVTLKGEASMLYE
jgi:Flp pilus assembly protein TadG